MKAIEKAGNIKANGHYSLAMIHNGTMYISGQLAINPETGQKELGSAASEAIRIFKNIDIILEEAGANKNDVIKSTVYVSDVKYWNEVNEEYSKYFGGHKPARVIVPTRDLHFGFKIEIEMIVAIGDKL